MSKVKEQLNHNQHAILNALEAAGRPLTAKDLEQRTGMHQRQLRDEVRSMRKKGMPIASGNYGYLLARRRSDIQYTILRLQSHAQEEKEIVSALTQTLGRMPE